MATITDEDLEAEFSQFGMELDLMIIEKMKEICRVYKLDAENLVEEWVAFASSNLQPNLKLIEDFKTKLGIDQRNKSTQSVKHETRDVKMYSKDDLPEFLSDEHVDMLEKYQTPETKKSFKRLHTTPESGNKMRHTLNGRTPTSSFSPASLPTPSATPAKRYEARENPGEVALTYNPGGMPDKNLAWSQRQTIKVQNLELEPLKEKFKYMFQKIVDKSQVLNEHIDKMASQLKDAHKIEEFVSAALVHQDDISVVGRICCDTNGKLNSSSLVLRESGTNSFGASIPLNVRDVEQYSLFPGKVLAVKGKNPTGTQFIASSFYEGIPPPKSESGSEQNGNLSVFIAVGPFTTSESDSYEPLIDFLNQVLKEEPDLVVMMGPFIDAKNDLIENCEISETFQQLFARKVNEIGKCAKRLSTTKFLLIPSQRDVHHHSVYPQPPFCSTDVKNILNSIFKEKNKREEIEKNISALHFFSDPCTLDINGFTFGMTSTDVLFHMGSEEIAYPPGSADKMGRLVRNILTQQCYYPLFPPSEEVCVDYEVFSEHAQLPYQPDVFLVPSDLRYFVKNVMGCLSINPGRLTKGLVGGTYTRLLLKREGCRPVADTSLCQIVKI
ncbi:DNA polymerase alpha subunit B-like [Dendronephthya gigantea]|uniref:DNA polymerase alpha subunit B-like n=1 Tax=Dendronephthya gigantea TaxID=151771 RepID=UPI00106AB82E|nr:DNA polymerase alpha subunit B-like [Dendronephthya gigantea]